MNIPQPADYQPQPFSSMPLWKLANIVENDGHGAAEAFAEFARRSPSPEAVELLRTRLKA